MYGSIEKWLESLPEPLQYEVSEIMKISKHYFQENSSFFRNCGFYVVGSSLVRPDFEDIDLVLVGLDFREVFQYTEAFLDPQKLSEGTKREAEENGESIGHYSIFQIENKPELYRLKDKIGEVLPQYQCDDMTWGCPFRSMPYVHDSLGEWLVSRAELYKGKSRFKPDGPIIDLMFHAENLLVSSWKEWQEKERLPYLPIVELYDPVNDRIENRSSFGIELPDFVDAEGKMHMKMKYHQEGHGKLKGKRVF